MEDKLNIDGVNHQLLDLLSSKIPGEKRRLLTGDIFKWPIYGLGLDIGGLDYIPIPLDCCNVLTNQL